MLLFTSVLGNLLFSHDFHPYKLLVNKLKLDVESAIFSAELAPGL